MECHKSKRPRSENKLEAKLALCTSDNQLEGFLVEKVKGGGAAGTMLIDIIVASRKTLNIYKCDKFFALLT